MENSQNIKAKVQGKSFFLQAEEFCAIIQKME